MHKFKIGRLVVFRLGWRAQIDAALGVYQITRRLPQAEDGAVAEHEALPVELWIGLLDGPGRGKRRDISAKTKAAACWPRQTAMRPQRPEQP